MMTKNTKILIGILTLVPLLGFIYMFATVFSTFFKSISAGGPDAIAIDGITSLITTMSILALVSLGLLIYYIVHVVNNKKISGDEKILWVLLFVFLHNISFIIYWIMRIWPNNDEQNTIMDDII